MVNLKWNWEAIPSNTEEERYYAIASETIFNALSDSDLADLEYRPYEPQNPLPNRDFTKVIDRTGASTTIQYFTPDGQKLQRFSSSDLLPITEGDNKKAEIILNALSQAFENQNYHPSLNIPDDIKKAHANFSRTTYPDSSTSLVLPMGLLRDILGKDVVDEKIKGLYTYGVPQAIFYDEQADVDEYIPPHIRTSLEQATGKKWGNLTRKEKEIFTLFHEEGHRRTYDLLNKDYPEAERDYVLGREEADANAIAIRGMQTYWRGTSSPTQNRPIEPSFFMTRTKPWSALKNPDLNTSQIQEALARQQQAQEARAKYQQMQQMAQERNQVSNEQMAQMLAQLQANQKKGLYGNRYRNFRMVESAGLRGGGAIEFDAGRRGREPRTMRISPIGGTLAVNFGTGTNLLTGHVLLRDQAKRNATPIDLLNEGLQHKSGFEKWVLGHSMSKDDEARGRNVSLFQNRAGLQRIRGAFGFGRGEDRLSTIRESRAYLTSKGRTAYGVEEFGQILNMFGDTNEQLSRELGLEGTIPNARDYASFKAKRLANMGRLDSAFTAVDGRLLPFRSDIFNAGESMQVAMQARYLMGVQFAEGETEKHRGVSSFTPEQYEIDSAIAKNLQVGQYYGSLAGVGRGNITGNIKALRDMGLNISDSPQAYQVLEILHNERTGRSNVVMGRMNEATMQKSILKPSHATRQSDLMALIAENSPFSNEGIDGRVHFQTRHTSDLLAQARESTRGAFAVLGKEKYATAIKQFVQENRGSLEGQHIADAFAVHYYTQGLDIGGQKIGGFDWTRTTATISEDRLGQYVSKSKPKDNTWEYDQATDQYYRTITHGGITRRVVEAINKRDRLGVEVSINDLVHISPVATDIKESFGKGVARIKPDSIIARGATDPSFAENLIKLDRAGIGRTGAYYHVLADVASRQIGVAGDDYLKKQGFDVLNVNDIDFSALSAMTEGLTGKERAEVMLKGMDKLYGDKFIQVSGGESKAYFAPAGEMLKMLTGDEDDKAIYNIAGKFVGLLDAAHQMKYGAEGTDKEFAMAVGGIIQEQQEYVQNANLQTKAGSMYLPAVTGHAQPARGLKSNQVAMWMSEIKRKTRLSEQEIIEGIGNRTLSMMLTRYPETDQTKATIGAEILLADNLTRRERKRIGLSGKKDQMLMAEAIMQAMTGDFDADQIQGTFSQYRDRRGNIAGGGIKIHSEDEIRAIRDTRFGNEYQSTIEKLNQRGDAARYFRDQAAEALKRVSADQMLGNISKAVRAKSLIGKMYNFGVRGIFPSADKQFAMSDKVGQIYKESAGLLSAGLYQPALDAEFQPGAEAVADLMYGYANVNTGGIGLRNEGDAFRTEYSPVNANRRVMEMFGAMVKGYEDPDERRLIAQNTAKLFMSPEETQRLLDAGEYEAVIGKLTSQFENMPAGDLSPEYTTEMYNLMLGEKRGSKVPLFGQDIEDPSKSSFLGRVISGMMAKRTRENAEYALRNPNKVRQFDPDLMSSYMKQQADFMSEVLEGVQATIPHKSFRARIGGSILETLKHTYGSLNQFGKLMSQRFGQVTDMQTISNVPAELASITGGYTPHPTKGLAYLGDKIVNLSFGQEPTRILNTANQFVSGNYITGSMLNPEYRETEAQWRKRIALMGHIPKEWIGGLHSDDMRGISRQDRGVIQSLVNLTREQAGLQPKILRDSAESLAGVNIHRQLQQHLLGDVADIQHINYEEMAGGRSRAVLDPRARAEVRVVDDKAGISGTLDAIYKGMVLDFKTKSQLDPNISRYMNQMSAYHMMTAEGAGEINNEKIRRSGVVPLSQDEGLSAQERLAQSADLVKKLVGDIRGAIETQDREGAFSLLHNVYGESFGKGANISFRRLASYIERVNNELNEGENWKMGVIPTLGQEAVDEGVVDINLAKRKYDEIKSLTEGRNLWDATDAKHNLLGSAKTLLGRAKEGYKSFLRGFRSADPVSYVFPRFDAGKQNEKEQRDISGTWAGGDKPDTDSDVSDKKDISGTWLDQNPAVFAHGETVEVKAEHTGPIMVDDIIRARIGNTDTRTTPKSEYYPITQQQLRKFYSAIDTIYGKQGFGEGQSKDDATPEIGVTKLRDLGFTDDEIKAGALEQKTPFELMRSNLFAQKFEAGTLTAPQLTNLTQFNQSMIDAMLTGRQISARVRRSGGEDPFAVEGLRHAQRLGGETQFNLMGKNRETDKALINATRLAHLIGGDGDAKSESASSALQKFIDTTGRLTPEFEKSIKSMKDGFNEGGESFRQATQRFEAWSSVLTDYEKMLAPAVKEQLTSGAIREEQFNALVDAQGVGGALVGYGESGQKMLNMDVHNATVASIRGQLEEAGGVAKEAEERRSQRSWKEMVGLSHEGAGITRRLTDAWNAPVKDGVFTEGAFAGMTKDPMFAGRVTGMSMLGAALNPYNMFAAQRAWGIFGGNAFGAMNQYQQYAVQQQALAYQGGLIGAGDLIAGQYGTIMGRRGRQAEATLGFGRTIDRAYGWTRDISFSPEGPLGGIAGVAPVAIGGGLGAASLFKGASAINVLAGGKAFAGLAGPIGWSVATGLAALGGISYMASGSRDLDALASGDLLAHAGVTLGFAGDRDRQKTRSDAYSDIARASNFGFRSGRFDINRVQARGGAGGLSAQEIQQGIQRGFKEVYKDRGQRLYGENYETDMMNVYRLGQTADPQFSMLANQNLTNRIMDLGAKYGTENMNKMMMDYAIASGSAMPTTALIDKASAWIDTLGDPLVGTVRWETMSRAMSSATMPRMMAGYQALDQSYFDNFNMLYQPHVGQTMGELAQVGFGTQYGQIGANYMRQIDEAMRTSDWNRAQTLLNTATATSGLVDSTARQMSFLGATPEQIRNASSAISIASERFGGDGQYQDVVAPFIAAMAQGGMQLTTPSDIRTQLRAQGIDVDEAGNFDLTDDMVVSNMARKGQYHSLNIGFETQIGRKFDSSGYSFAISADDALGAIAAYEDSITDRFLTIPQSSANDASAFISSYLRDRYSANLPEGTTIEQFSFPIDETARTLVNRFWSGSPESGSFMPILGVAPETITLPIDQYRDDAQADYANQVAQAFAGVDTSAIRPETLERFGNIIASSGDLDAILERRMIQRRRSFASADDIAQTRREIYGEVEAGTFDIAESMSTEFLNQADQFYGGWFGTTTQRRLGTLDFTDPLRSGNLTQMQRTLGNFFASSPGLTSNAISQFEQLSRISGYGSGDARQNIAGMMWTNQAIGGFGNLMQQGFYTNQDYMLQALANINARPDQYPFINQAIGLAGGAMNARLYRTNRADTGLVEGVQSGIYSELAGLDLGTSEGFARYEQLMARYGTEQFRLQAGIMGRTSGMGETAFLDASSLTNEELMTDSIRTNAQRLFEEFSGVLIENASLSQQSQQAVTELVLGGLDYGDEQAVQGRVRGLGRYSTAMSMLDRYRATGTSADQLSQIALQTIGMTGEQFAQWQGIESQNPYVMSRNLAGAQARWGTGAVPIAPVNLQTGLATTMTSFAPGGNMNFANIMREANQLYGGGMLAGYMDNNWLAQAGGTLGVQGQINRLQMGQIFASVGFQRQQNVLQRNLNMGGGTLDNQGFVTGGDGLRSFGRAMQGNGFNFNIGNGMSLWQIDDASTRLQREQQLYGLGTQERDRAMEWRHFFDRFNLRGEQFNWNTVFQRQDIQRDRERQLMGRGWTQEDMAFSRNQQTTQFVWQREDMAFGRARNALEFGWQTEDFTRNLRYARGRDRINLLREQERANVRYSMEVGQADKQESRQTQQEQWAEEQFNKQVDRFRKNIEFEDETYRRSVIRFEKGIEFEQLQMDMERRHFEERWGLQGQDFEVQRKHILEMMKLEDQDRLLQRQWQNASNEMQLRFSESVAGTNKRITELQNALTVFGLASEMVAKQLELGANVMAPPNRPSPRVEPPVFSGNTPLKVDPAIFTKLGASLSATSANATELNTRMDASTRELNRNRGAVDRSVEIMIRATTVSQTYNATLVQQSNAIHQNLTVNQALRATIANLSNFIASSLNAFNDYATRVSNVRTVMQNSLASFDQFNQRLTQLIQQLNSLSSGGAQAGGWGSAQSNDLTGVRTNTATLVNQMATMLNHLSTISANTGTAINPANMMNTHLSNIRRHTHNTIKHFNSVSAGQYKEGGYTGDGDINQAAGIVHKGEYVIPQRGVPILRESGTTSSDMLDELRKIRRAVEKLEAMGPGRLNVNAVINQSKAVESLIQDSDKIRQIR